MAQRVVALVILFANLASYILSWKYELTREGSDTVLSLWWIRMETCLGITAILAGLTFLAIAVPNKRHQ
jgi:hypothetical protein